MARGTIGIIEGLLEELKRQPFSENRQRAIEGLVHAKFYLQREESKVEIVQKPSDIRSVTTVSVINAAQKSVEKEFNEDLGLGADLAIKVLRSAE